MVVSHTKSNVCCVSMRFVVSLVSNRALLPKIFNFLTDRAKNKSFP